MEGYCRSCGKLRELRCGLCPVCFQDFMDMAEWKARHIPREVAMTLEGIAKAASEVPTSMADAFYCGALSAILNGSEYGWPRR